MSLSCDDNGKKLLLEGNPRFLKQIKTQQSGMNIFQSSFIVSAIAGRELRVAGPLINFLPVKVRSPVEIVSLSFVLSRSAPALL
jgi:hypothetical protein